MPLTRNAVGVIAVAVRRVAGNDCDPPTCLDLDATPSNGGGGTRHRRALIEGQSVTVAAALLLERLDRWLHPDLAPSEQVSGRSHT